MPTDEPAEADRLNHVLADIDRANGDDPTLEFAPERGESLPAALLYGLRMSERLGQYAPGADELLQIAVRAQHIRRWSVPRSDFPDGRRGYHRWRQTLGGLHARLTGELMAARGYDGESIATVQRWLRKEGLGRDPGTQTLEDVACLVFLEHYLEAFVDGPGQRHDEAKLLDILRRTWKKMSPEAREAALRLPLGARTRALVERALTRDAPAS